MKHNTRYVADWEPGRGLKAPATGSTILFLLAFPKNEQDDLTPAQLKVLKSIIPTEYP